MKNYYLAIDIGASSGRHILGYIDGGKIVTTEIYRFENCMVKLDGQLCWDVRLIFRHILKGISRCKEIGKIPISIGIDTWGVDFVLLDKDDNILGNAVAYRDSRTADMPALLSQIIPAHKLYHITGIQKQSFNTIYQLYALKTQQEDLLAKAKCFLMIPDFFNFMLTGVKRNEYTNATTTGLVNANSKEFDQYILNKIGIDTSIFCDIVFPKTKIGCLKQEIAQRVGFDTTIISVASHDTASAVAATPLLNDKSIYLSSGTWSLMGIESNSPNTSEEALSYNFTNEGGINDRFRFLKNIMGLWLLQNVKKETGLSYEQMAKLAKQNETFNTVIDVDDASFLAPDSMCQAVIDFCKNNCLPIPKDIGQIIYCIYNSLANCYAKTVQQIEKATGNTYDNINIVGGGSRDTYLNALTARETGKNVIAGPTEATALGNILAGMLANGEIESLEIGRKMIYDQIRNS